MDNAGYVGLARQSGLLNEIQTIANNIANAGTTGYRAKGVIFAEHVRRLDGSGPSLSLANGDARRIDLGQGVAARTGGAYDFAIEGEGFFQVETPAGPALTRAGAFAPNAEGELVSPDGHRLLDEGGSPVAIPPGSRAVTLASDGTLSADGAPLARIGLVRPTDPADLSHRGGTLFVSAAVEPVETPLIHQGQLEQSNVDAIAQVSRMVEVQRAYELGQGFLDREDERIRAVIQTLSR